MGRYSPGPGRCVVLADAEFSETSSHRMLDGLIDTSRLWLEPAHSLMKSTEKNTYCPEICKIFAYMLDKSEDMSLHILNILYICYYP